MKSFQVVKCNEHVRLVGLAFVALSLYSGMAAAQTDVIIYDPREWRKLTSGPACHDTTLWPDSGRWSYPFTFNDFPFTGYPMLYNLFVGVNDTFQVGIVLHNLTDETYDLTGKDCEHWYAPRVYPSYAAGPGGPPFKDSTDLGYRVRGWYESGHKVEPWKELPPRMEGLAIMDIWKLPEGHNQICIVPTQNVPAGFTAIGSGFYYEYYAAHSVADSINGYEACFWRAEADRDSAGMAHWVDKILTVNPTSIPGMWMKAFLALEKQDTLTAKQAIDKARAYFYSGADPAMPDSTKRPLSEQESTYMEHVPWMLSHTRNQLGP
jgi:hypothetical protein